MKLTIIILIILSNLHGNNLEKANEAYLKGNYTTANKYFRIEAKKGNLEAIHKVGYLYHYGKGIPKNYKEAFKWYTKSANQGYAKSEYNLGIMNCLGEGIPKNYKEAFKWYTKSANQGYAPAQYDLGVMYYSGESVSKNYEEAFKWYTKSANQGYAPAQYTLGAMNYLGEGIPKDYKETLKWYKKSANQGFVLAQYNLGVMYYSGEGVSKNYEEAYNWYLKASLLGHKPSKNALNIIRNILNQEKINKQKLAKPKKDELAQKKKQQGEQEKFPKQLKQKNSPKIQDKITEYCNIKASIFKSDRLKKHEFKTCYKNTLNKDLSLSAISKMIKDDNTIELKSKIEARKQESKLKRARKEKNKQKTMALETGIWKIKYYVDRFGERTKDAYITTSFLIKGTFSNTATQDSKLNVEFLINSPTKISIKLYEYAGNNPVKESVDNQYNLYIRDKNKKEVTLKVWSKSTKSYFKAIPYGKIKSDRLVIKEESAKAIHNALKLGGELIFILENASRATTIYYFKINADYYNNAHKKLNFY